VTIHQWEFLSLLCFIVWAPTIIKPNFWIVVKVLNGICHIVVALVLKELPFSCLFLFQSLKSYGWREEDLWLTISPWFSMDSCCCRMCPWKECTFARSPMHSERPWPHLSSTCWMIVKSTHPRMCHLPSQLHGIFKLEDCSLGTPTHK
jgi:hypothetical protein